MKDLRVAAVVFNSVVGRVQDNLDRMLPWIENANVSPSASLADGVKLYAAPTVTSLAGLPLIVGAVFGSGTTVIENAARLALSSPSDTLIRILEYVPSSASEGVPDRRPVLLLKLAQDGLPWIENVSVSPSASLADGTKLYASSTVT